MGQREKRNNNREKGKITYTLFRTLPSGLTFTPIGYKRTNCFRLNIEQMGYHYVENVVVTTRKNGRQNACKQMKNRREATP
ncbi:hypothetical protein [Bacteroides heparinolyticus]|uniref:hypothetical protein n=1 Tax=Prevotella heparinolytica TaxID=28113 RepID=UPI0035A03CC3